VPGWPSEINTNYSPELNPTEAIGDVIKDWIGNVLWETIPDLEQAIGEELRPLYENAEAVRRLVSHPWLVEQANATATENSAITCSKWYDTMDDVAGAVFMALFDSPSPCRRRPP
jgi:hypothetical protein